MSPIRRLPGAPPPPLAMPYRCLACGRINWFFPHERVETSRCAWCGAVGRFSKESLLEHIVPRFGRRS